jgi:hypothetical protein
LAFFCGWSSAKLGAPDEDVSKTVHPQDIPAPEPQRGESGPPPLVINSIVNPPGADNNHKRDTPFWEKAAVVVALGLLIVNIFLLHVTNKAATAAKDSVDLARDNAHMDQRAWVAVSDISSNFRQDENWTVNLFFKNTGRTPAKNFVIWGAGEPVAKGQKPISEEIRLPGRGVIAPDGIFHSNLSISGHYDWKAIDLVIHGRIDYDSVFGRGHSTKFCYYFVPSKTGKGGFAPCESGNDVDNNPP